MLMVAHYVDELAQLVPPPGAPWRVDWSEVEAVLELTLPSDYKVLVSRYGQGVFDNFLWLLVPSGNPNLDFLRQAHLQLESLADQVPELEGTYLPWAVTDNGDRCLWRRSSTDPDQWSVVVVDSRAPEWSEHPGPATRFLNEVLSRATRSDVFPENFPSSSPRFSPA